jgi:FixJ family two-component response regulator
MHADPNPYDVRLAFVLDDEVRLGAALSKMMATIGISARSFIAAAEFLSALEDEKPDLIFLDLALGESDAVEVIRQLEARKFTGRVMLISGRDARTLLDVERIGREHGLDMLPSLPKPFRMADIKENLLPSPALQPELWEQIDAVKAAVPARSKA